MNDAFVVFEATGSYDKDLTLALEASGIALARVNPAQARDFARACSTLAKTDTIDSQMLADMVNRLAADTDAGDLPRTAQTHRPGRPARPTRRHAHYGEDTHQRNR